MNAIKWSNDRIAFCRLKEWNERVDEVVHQMDSNEAQSIKISCQSRGEKETDKKMQVSHFNMVSASCFSMLMCFLELIFLSSESI